MKKYLQPAVIAALVVASLFLLSRSCGLSEKYKLARDDYRELALITAADKVMSDARIAELNKAIGQADKTIGQKEAEIVVKNAEIVVLSNQLDELIANEPVQPELESQPLVISLRKQVKTLTDLYSISTSTITLQAEEISLLSGKFDAQVTISETWKREYDREHMLRVNCESLLKLSEKRVSNPWKTVRNVAVGVAAGFVVGSLLKK